MNRLTNEQRDHLRGLIQGIRGAAAGHINMQGVYSPGLIKTVGAAFGQDWILVDTGAMRFAADALEAAVKEDEPPNRYTYPHTGTQVTAAMGRLGQCNDCGATVSTSGQAAHDRWHQNE